MVEFRRVGRRHVIAVLTWPDERPHHSETRRAGLLQTALVDLLGSHGPRLVIDLAAMPQCDATTARAIRHAEHRARRRGGWVRVVSADPAVTCELARQNSAVVYPNVACPLNATSE